MGRKMDFRRDLPISFGDMYEVPVLHSDNNVLHQRTQTVIAVGTTGNINGAARFFNPWTGGFLTRTSFGDPLPMNDVVIKRLTDMWLNDGNRDISQFRKEPRFTVGHSDREVQLVPDMIDDDLQHALTPQLRAVPVSYAPTDVPDSTEVPDSAEPCVPASAPRLPLMPGDPPHLYVANSDSTSLPDYELRGGMDDISDHAITLVDSAPAPAPVTIDETAPAPVTSKAPVTSVTPVNYTSPPTVGPRYNLRSNRSSWKGRVFLSSQLSRKQAAAKYGDLAVRAQMKELMQMRDLEVMYPINFHTLNRDQRRKVIRSHMIFQPKHDPNTGEFIKLKARFVADGSTQDKSMYEDVSSPTVSTHAVFINAAIAAKERRLVKVVDLPGAYLHADMSGEEVLMHISKDDAEILIMMDPEYKQYLRSDGTMIVKLSKALYGCIESAKLWYAEISKTFRSIGYACNPKDICVFNKTVEGVQCTITLHVDDLMVTSIKEQLIDEVMNALRKEYERDGAALDVKVGKVHNYLGMTFDFSVEGEVCITMNKYVSELLKFTDIKGTVSTPATTELYTVIESDKLDSVKSEYFHSVVAKLLYLSKRVRPDLLTSVGYLAKRVTDSTKMDMVKLERALRYLNGTSQLGLTLRPSEHLSIFSHIDASYAVHNDMKSQTGVTITLGEGVTYAKSTTQQLNSKSSTEAELIALTDASGHVIWVRDYLIGQGYPIGPATIYQDNMSTMALVKKGYSTSNNTRHINIRYFFIKDRIDNEELKIEYLPTEDMIADFFTKPLQGDLFKKLRDKVLGLNPINRAFIACL
jgi:hypothetical protein